MATLKNICTFFQNLNEENTETGRKYRVEIAIDVTSDFTEERRQDAVVKMYQEMEMLANRSMKAAIAAETPDESIHIILEHLGKFLNGERTYIFERNESGGDDNTYEWCAPGVTPEKDNLQNVPPEVCANWYRHFEDGKAIVIGDLEETKESDPLQYENLKRQVIHSLVVVPLYDAGKVIAFYGVDNPPPMFLKYSHDMLQIEASFLISCLRRRTLRAKLLELSFQDALTRLGNRFALTAYVKRLDPSQSLAVVYCDITGLKQVNDTQGHEAGDALIPFTHAIPAAVHPGHERMSSFFQYNRPLGSVRIQSRLPPALSPSAPHCPHRTPDAGAHRLLVDSHASADLLLQKSPAPYVHRCADPASSPSAPVDSFL